MHSTTLRSIQWLAIILVIVGIGVAYFLTRTKAAVTINTSQNTQQTGSLVGLWSFNGPDVSGTTAYDRSSSPHNGTLTNGPTVIEGKSGQALNFDGTNQYVSVGSVGSGVRSISFWIKANTITQKIIDLGGSANIEVIGQTITANGFTSPTIYVDGAVSSFIDTNWHFVTITTGTGINASAVNIGRVGSSYFAGRLDEVRMYGNAVSSQQIASLYSSGGQVSGAIPPPIISALSSGTPGYYTATITWTTNTASTSYVEYGITTGYGTTIGSATAVTSHSVALSGLSESTTYHFRVHSVNAPENEGISGDNTFVTTAWLCGTAVVTFTYNGSLVTYGTVTGADGKCWMDRNLGATQVATSSTDSASYGHLFQWGRDDDGHQIPTSGTTSTNADVPGNNLFITELNSPNDWRVNQDGTLWANSSSTNNPCPVSWHVPTWTEWDTWVTSANVTDPGTAYSSTLKLPRAGYRNGSAGVLLNQGSYGAYWSSSPYGTIADNLTFYSGGVQPPYYYNRAYGFSVRCVKD